MSIDSFKFWCQPVQPLTFDDSISYLEMLGKVSDKLNEVITSQNDLDTATKTAISNFQHTIDEFIVSETKSFADFKTEMNNKYDTFISTANGNYNSFVNTVNTILAEVEKGLARYNFTDTVNMWDILGNGARIGYAVQQSNHSLVKYKNGYVSGYIPVEPNETYAYTIAQTAAEMSLDNRIIWYDKNYTYISSTNGTSNSWGIPNMWTLVAPASAYYARIQFEITDIITQIIKPVLTNQSLKNSAFVKYNPDSSEMPSLITSAGKYKSDVHASNVNEIQNYKRNITFRDCDFFTYSRNLFDNNTTRTPIEVGYLNYNDYTWVTDSTVFTSTYIPVKCSDYIKVSSHTNGTKGNLASIIFYDNDKNIIGTISDSMASNNIVSTVIPTNCRYIRFTDMIANVDTDMCTYDGGDMTTFVAYTVPTISV